MPRIEIKIAIVTNMGMNEPTKSIPMPPNKLSTPASNDKTNALVGFSGIAYLSCD
ncbi:MAG: hypothetical protein QW128_01280 [Thermoprotei archaeon]